MTQDGAKIIKADSYFEGDFQKNNPDFPSLIVDGGKGKGYALYRFSIDKEGCFELHARYACAESRPVQVFIDGALMKEDGLKETTGGWTLNSAKIFKETAFNLSKGEHILKLSREGCIPHIAELVILKKNLQFSADLPGKLVLPPEIKDMISSGQLRSAHPELMEYSRYKEYDTLSGVIREATANNSGATGENKVFLAGDDPESHRWGAGCAEDDFHLQMSRLKEYIAGKKTSGIVIGVRRTNFFKLPKIIKLIAGSGYRFKKEDFPGFEMAPLHNIKSRFYDYLGNINAEISKDKVELKIVDSGLDGLLKVIEDAAKLPDYRENELLRALGPVCKDAFIGPRFILLNLSGLCNADCVYCRKFSPWIKWNTEGEHLHGSQFLDFDIVERVLKEAQQLKVENILIVGEGEPTIYPDFLKVIKLIKKYDLRYNISTNGMLLNKYEQCLIEDRACDAVTVSMSFASRETFSKMRPNTPLKYTEIIESNIKSLSELKRKNYNNCPEIITLHAINKFNYKEIIEMALKARALGADAIWYQMVHLSKFSEEKLRLDENEMQEIKRLLRAARTLCIKNDIKFHSFIDYELEHFDASKGDWSKQGLLSDGCFVGWHFAFMDLRNTLSFCCGMKIVGFLDNGKSFKEQWFADVYRRYRNDGVILHRENPLDLFGKPLYEKFCDSCDNHDQNNMMLASLKKYGLSEYVER
ncbi:MAG: radical SAM protein [Candidatus Omnitrophica bacterium]|nr:radical SAM protein [Candidatus Omnitrophota bacterium]